MTYWLRMQGLTRKIWSLPGSATARCQTCRDWVKENLSMQRAGRHAREHTRATGHRTWTEHIKVTEYGPAEPGNPG